MKRKRPWSLLFLGFVLTATATCRPATKEDPIPDTVEPLPTIVPVTTLAQKPTATPAFLPQPTDTISPPPLPTAAPTVAAGRALDAWQKIGGETAALQIAAPPEWVDFSGRLAVSEATRRLGLIVLLLADSERTGSSLLAGKELNAGAFVTGLIASGNWSPADPAGALNDLVAGLGAMIEPLSPPVPVSISGPADSLPSDAISEETLGAFIDVMGDPLEFFTPGGDNLRSRIVLLPHNEGEALSSKNSQALVIFSAPVDQWDLYENTFTQMVETIVTRKIRAGFYIGGGSADVLGRVGHMEPVNGKLDRNVRDVWTFATDGPGYATLTLSPTDKDIDLTLAVFSPTGEPVAQIDNGFAGDAEVAADLFLAEAGTYVVEIGEFFNDSGRYTLNLSLSDRPLFASKGHIAPGQGIQSDLPSGARHVWSFEGTAGEQVSIILKPGRGQFDAILVLFDPEGNRLVALDEGFSGDAEVISGFELPVTGEYTILVRSFAGDGGTYALSLDEGNELTRNFHDAGNLRDGNIKEESLREGEVHAWFFDGRVGDAVSVEVTPLDETLDLELWLLDPDVRRLAVEDRFTEGEQEAVAATLSSDGQFLVLVREFYGKAGDYRITFSSQKANAPDDAGVLTYGIPVTGTLATGQSVLWRFWGDVDDVIDLQVTPLDASLDLVLLLQDPLANTVLEIDAALAGLPEGLNGFTITADGQWRVLIREFFKEEGAYTLTVQRSQP